MSQPLTFSQVNDVLSCNQQWMGGYGPKGEPALSKKEKGAICGMVVKKLAACFDINGDAFLAELWPTMKQALATQNWFARYQMDQVRGKRVVAKRGDVIPTYVLINVMYQKASKVAENKIKTRMKTNPTSIGQELAHLDRKTIMQTEMNVMEHAGFNEVFN